jgi:uncharacterized protein (DUF849 family)
MTEEKGLRSGEKVLRKVIITAAVTGAAHTPTMSDYLPLTPKQIADDAVRAHEAGAAIVHVHARLPETGEPSPKLEIFREILTSIKSRCNVVICITTGGAGDEQERIAVVPEFKPELATLNCGSMSGTAIQAYERLKDKIKYEWEHEHMGREWFVFENTFKMMREYSQIDRENNTKPELEIWDLGQIGAVDFMVRRGYVDKPIHLQFVMGALSGMQATPGTLVFVYEQAKRILGDFTWSVASAGRDQIPMAAVTLALGGHVRVGLEDSLYAGYGRMAMSSAEQVERVVNIARELSIEPATPDEARQMLGLKGLDKVNF